MTIPDDCVLVKKMRHKAHKTENSYLFIEKFNKFSRKLYVYKNEVFSLKFDTLLFPNIVNMKNL